MKNVSTRILLGLMAFGAMLAAAVMAMAPAHASPTDLDNQFLQLMERDGISYSAGLTGEIQAAHWICSARMSGSSEVAVATVVYQQSQLDKQHSAALVLDAEQVYCPGYFGTSVGGTNV